MVSTLRDTVLSAIVLISTKIIVGFVNKVYHVRKDKDDH